MTIYLYKKTHNKTGLQYLGKTKSTDPHKYQGSGKRWCHHIKKHGYDVTTEILKECQTNEELREWGKYYSELWDVVNDDNWANLKLEEGDGGDNSHCENYRKNWHLFSNKGENNPSFGKHWQWTPEQKANVTGENNNAYGKTWDEERRSREEEKGYYWTGRKRPFAKREYDFLGDKNPNAKKVITPNGLFNTLKDAAASHKIGPDALRGRIRRMPDQYYYQSK